MHLIHRPYRRLPRLEKVLAIFFAIVLFVVIKLSISFLPPTYNIPQNHQEKYYTIVISEDELNQIERFYQIYHPEAPFSFQKVQY